MHLYRTHTCGQLRRADIGQAVTLAGWVHRRREHGGLIFVDVRDRHGLTQVVCDHAASPEAYAQAGAIGSEWVVQVEGTVAERFEANPDLQTGEIEVRAAVVRVVNAAKVPPFEIARDLNLDEAQRLRYRYLDLRRERMARNMWLRHRVTAFVRSALNDEGFVEIETPILTRSTPEGARDFLVPSRLSPGAFYALPQSPQQMKQLLMVAGMDRYYQVARCFRDEDLRADRQLEFTQLDIEMSFVGEDDVMALNERMFVDLCRAVVPDRPIQTLPFPRMTYAEAMRRYGNDKPDLRFGMTMEDLGDLFADSEFGVFRAVVESGGAIKAICAPRLFSRKEIADLEAVVKGHGAGGLAWVAWEGGETLYRGGSGPVHVQKGPCSEPLHEMFLQAGQQAGYPGALPGGDVDLAEPEGAITAAGDVETVDAGGERLDEVIALGVRGGRGGFPANRVLGFEGGAGDGLAFVVANRAL